MTKIWTGNDEDALAFYDYHHSLVLDRQRSEVFLRSIVNTVKPGDVVVEVGTGTGLLSLIAVTAGARKVYAIEHERIVDVAREVVRVNGVADRVELVVGKSTEIELPELGDVLITETIGNAAFDEGILTWVADARSRLLKPDARLIPQQLSLICALLELPKDHLETEKLMSRHYTYDLSPLRSLVVGRMAWDDLSPVSVVSDPKAVITTDLYDAATSVTGSCVLSVRRDATVHAIGSWFEAVIAPGETLTNGPPNSTPSWNQGVTMLEKPFDLVVGDEVEVQVDVNNDGNSYEFAVGRK